MGNQLLEQLINDGKQIIKLPVVIIFVVVTILVFGVVNTLVSIVVSLMFASGYYLIAWLLRDRKINEHNDTELNKNQVADEPVKADK